MPFARAAAGGAIAAILLGFMPGTQPVSAQEVALAPVVDNQPLDKVRLRLKWYHQFQFAGYYAALAQGYYREAGLDVEIIEGDPELTSVQAVLQGQAEFGVSGPEVLFNYLNGEPLVALAPVFQHSPTIILTLADSGITSPQDMVGKRFMNYEGYDAAEYSAVLLGEGISLDKVQMVKISFDIQQLVNREVDTYAAYLTNEPYFLESQGIAVTIIRPLTYGIDFYGDTLFTSQAEVQAHPERVRAFRDASLRGWDYAMHNSGEIIDLLIEQYGCAKQRDHLEYEAEVMRELILPDLVEIGHMNPGRWERMAETYAKLNMITEIKPLDNFIYTPDRAPDSRWLRLVLLIVGLASATGALVTVILLVFNRRLRAAVKARTVELSLANQRLLDDIQARQEIEEALRRSERNLGNIFDNAITGIIVTDFDGRIKQANPRLAEMLGYTQVELLGMDYYDLVAEIEHSAARLNLDTARAADQSEFAVERQFIHRDGRLLTCAVTGKILRGEHDEPAEMLLVITDITQRKRAEEALRTSEEFNRAIIDHSPLGISVRSRTGRLLSCNKAWQHIWGRTAAEIAIDMTRERDALRFDQRDAYLADWQQAVQEVYTTGGTLLIPHVKEECNLAAGVKWVSQCFYAIKDQAGAVDRVVILTEDITERMEAEAALQQSRQRLDRAQEIARMGTWERRLVDSTITWSAELYRIIGYEPGEIELTAEFIATTIHQDDRGHFTDLFSGAGIPASQFELDYRVLHRDGSIRHVHDWISVEHDEHNRVLCISGTSQDISERKQAEEELRRSQEQLHQAQKMEAIGVLAGGIAHDFNNVLFAILGNADMASEELADNHPVRKYLREISTAGKRATELVRQILAFSRQSEVRQVHVKLRDLILEITRLIRSSLPSTIEIKHHLSFSGTTIIANPTEIHQVLMNLCANAGHAMRDSGGKLEIALDEVLIDEEFISQHPMLHPGRHAVIAVSDTGPGIDPAVIEHIFEPFYTTKPVGEGTGMGLAVVHGIVAGLGGMVTVYSEPGRGASFKVYLPLIDDESEDRVLDRPVTPRGTEHILYIDDEEAIVRMASRLLSDLGYRVTAETSSTRGFELFRAAPDSFDLIITDQTMPGLTGKELTRSSLELRPGLPVILCTGFSHVLDDREARHLGVREFLLKPFTRDDLARAIRRALGDPDFQA